MDIIKETEVKNVSLDIDMEDEEISNLACYFNENCTDDELISVMVNWSLNDILKNKILEDQDVR